MNALFEKYDLMQRKGIIYVVIQPGKDAHETASKVADFIGTLAEHNDNNPDGEQYRIGHPSIFPLAGQGIMFILDRSLPEDRNSPIEILARLRAAASQPPEAKSPLSEMTSKVLNDLAVMLTAGMDITLPVEAVREMLLGRAKDPTDIPLLIDDLHNLSAWHKKRCSDDDCKFNEACEILCDKLRGTCS